MLHELKPGCRVVYHGMLGVLEEFVRHDSALVRLEEGGGIVEVPRAALIALAAPDKTLGKTELNRIDPVAWKQAEARAQAVREVMECLEGRTQLARRKARELHLSERQFWRMLADYQRHRMVSAMITKVGGRRVGTTILDAEVEHIIAKRYESDYLQRERPTIKALFERIAADCRQVGRKPPTQATVRRRVARLAGRVALLKREGSKHAKYHYDPMPGHVEVSRRLERVEIDHTPLDMFALSDDVLCAYVGRPWLTVAIDVYTRCVLGIHIGFEPPSALSVALCLTHAVLPKSPAEEVGVPLDWIMHGLPREIVVDNGKDFQSEAFRRGCDEYGIQLSYRPVGSPHYGGTIERLIGTMVGQCHLLPGTTKNSIKAKGDYNPQTHATMTLSQVRRWFVEQLLGRYHTREHRMLRVPPLVAWQQAANHEEGNDNAAH